MFTVVNRSHDDSFATLLRRFRLSAQLTQEELAEQAGMSARGISDLERGVRTNPHPTTVRRLAESLGLSPADRDAFFVAGRGPAIEPFQLAPRLAMSPGHTPATLDIPLRFPYPSSNVPDEPNRFIGREREIAEISELLQRQEIRLLTMTGSGGTGKTRLAIKVCARLQDDFPDGIIFVPLASVSDAALVPAAIAQDVGCKPENGRDLLTALTEQLAARAMVLVLDNFEHVLDAASVVATLLDACRSLHVLVTSRRLLHLRREHQYAVLPLAMPDAAIPPEVDALARYDAIALFQERARAVQASFAITPENARAVVEICARLDGLPLAIELAAARINLFSPAALASRLSRSLTVLTGGPSDVPIRQQTLRATVGWSYALLAPGEQDIFARLSVFAGGCTLEAAEAVCGAGDVARGIAALVDQSLLRREGGDEPRFTMLETIRQYAAEKLVERGSEDELREAHARYFLALVEQAEPGLKGPLQIDWVERLEADHDNLRAVLAWSLQCCPEVGLRLAIAIVRFWEMGNYWTEAQQWFQRLLPFRRHVSPAIGARAVLAGNRVVFFSARSEGLLREAVSTFRTLGDPRGAALALGELANCVAYDDRHDEALILGEEGLELAREVGDAETIDHLLVCLASIATWRGDLAHAIDLSERQLERARARGDLWTAFRVLHRLAEIAALRWDGEATLRYGREALEIGRMPGHSGALRLAHLAISYGLFILGRFDEANEHAKESLRREWMQGSVHPLQLEQLTLCAVALAEPERAARLWSAANTRREAIGVVPPAIVIDIYQRHITMARQELGEEQWRLAYQQGRSMSTAQTVAYALGDC